MCVEKIHDAEENGQITGRWGSGRMCILLPLTPNTPNTPNAPDIDRNRQGLKLRGYGLTFERSHLRAPSP
jgi:hypothetical protein